MQRTKGSKGVDGKDMRNGSTRQAGLKDHEHWRSTRLTLQAWDHVVLETGRVQGLVLRKWQGEVVCVERTGLEWPGVPYPVKVVEGGPELVHLFLADTFSIAGQDLVLNFVDGAGNGCQELFPAHPYVL